MTDEQMDARLRAAGERWRTENPTVAVVEPVDTTEHAADVVPPTPHRRRGWGLLASAAAVAAALVVGGTFLLRDARTGPGPSGDTAALEGHVWLLSGQHGETNSTATLYIDRDGNLVADDECTLIGGTAEVDGNSMTVTNQVVRYKSCTDQYGPGYYADGTAVLDGASTFTITSDALTITDNGKELDFTLAPANTPVPTLDFPTLIGANWQLVSAKDADGNDVTVAGDPTLLIDDSGQVSGTDGCNSLMGTVTIDGANIIFGQIGGTEKYCPGDAGATETAILAFMQGTASEVVVGGRLTLTKGNAELVYRWVPGSSDNTDPALLYGTTWHLVDNAGTDVPVGSTLTVCAQLAQGCFGAPWIVGPGTLAVGTDGELTPLQDFFGRGGTTVWSVSDGKLLVYLNDTQGSAFVLTKDASEPPPTSTPLLGTTWQLTSITFGDTVYRNGAAPALPSTLILTANSFDAKHVCYTNEGDLTQNGDRLNFSGGHAVKAIPCPFNPGNGPEDQAIDGILGPDVTWSVADGTLTLTKAGDTLVYSDGTSLPQNLPLAGTDWRLETAVAESNAASAASGQSFAIDGSGRLTASDGVNTISGPVQTGDSTLDFGQLSTTEIGSLQDDPVRDAIDAMLSGEVGYGITGDTLTLTKATAQLIYRAHTATTANDSIVGSWHLTTIEHGTGPDGSASTSSSPGPLVFGEAPGVGFGNCSGAAVEIGASTLTFTQAWVTDTPTNCERPDASDADFIFGKILTGTCTYAIDGDQLTITKDGVGALVFTRS